MSTNKNEKRTGKSNVPQSTDTKAELFDERTRQIFKSNLERVLSDILSAKYDCNIKITLREKPEYKGGAESENSDTEQKEQSSTASDPKRRADRRSV